MHDRKSPWLAYFDAVYGEAMPVPLALDRINFFYLGTSAWYEVFPRVHNPFRPCARSSERATLLPCQPQLCKPWWVPMASARPRLGVARGRMRVDVSALRGGQRGEERRAWGWPDHDGLDSVHIFDFGAIFRSKARGLPTVGGWVEVTRLNVLNRGTLSTMIEEGVSHSINIQVNVASSERLGRQGVSLEQPGLTYAHYQARWPPPGVASGRASSHVISVHPSRASRHCTRHEQRHACAQAFFSAVTGSGVWAYTGAYLWGRQVFTPTTEPTSDGYTRVRAVDVTPDLARGAHPSSGGEPVRCVVWTRGGAIDVKFDHAPYADRPVGLVICPPDGTLRSGWRARLSCACDEGSTALNCHRGSRAARRVPRADRPYIGPWLDPFNPTLVRHGLSPMAAHPSWPGMVMQLEKGASMFVAGANAPIGGRASGASARAVELASWQPNPAPCSLYVARRSGLRVCSATFGDGPYRTRVHYVESGALMRVADCLFDVCALLRAHGSGEPSATSSARPSRSFVFTFVGEPLAHLLDALARATIGTPMLSAVGRRTNRRANASIAVGDAIRAMVLGADCGAATGVRPQVACVASAVSGGLVTRRSIDFVGRLETFRDDWARIRHFVRDWPALRTPLCAVAKQRRDTRRIGDVEASRAALSSDHLLAACRMLLPDYACFGYSLPHACASLGDAQHNVSCPLLPTYRPTRVPHATNWTAYLARVLWFEARDRVRNG